MVFRPGSCAASGAMAVTSDTTEVVTPPAVSICRSAASSLRADTAAGVDRYLHSVIILQRRKRGVEHDCLRGEPAITRTGRSITSIASRVCGSRNAMALERQVECTTEETMRAFRADPGFSAGVVIVSFELTSEPRHRLSSFQSMFDPSSRMNSCFAYTSAELDNVRAAVPGHACGSPNFFGCPFRKS
jgi:hypothetical protein